MQYQKITVLKDQLTGIKINQKYQKISKERHNQYLDYFIDLRFHAVNRFFVLLFEGEGQRTGYKRYYLSTVEIKDYNVMFIGQDLFDQPN